MILAVIGYAIYLIQIYVAKPLCFLCENTFLFLEDKWELPMGSRGTVILLLFGVKKQKVVREIGLENTGLLLQRAKSSIFKKMGNLYKL